MFEHMYKQDTLLYSDDAMVPMRERVDTVRADKTLIVQTRETRFAEFYGINHMIFRAKGAEFTCRFGFGIVQDL